jgi:asparagine N-glycosylation enzyme membrane subunit Stt3
MKFIPFILLLFTVNLFCQTSYKLKLDAISESNEYGIQIDKSVDSSRVTYFKLMDKRRNYSVEDSIRLDELRKKWKTAEENKEYYSIINEYKMFEKDTLNISNNSLMIKYSDSLIKNEANILLEKKEQPIYIHALEIKVSVNEKEKYSVYNPNKNNYRLVFLLIKEALSIYKKRTDDPILTENYTGEF